MRSPAYNPHLDIIADAGDGQIGAFCIVWLDHINKVGLFEPVGTIPEFRRKGLGKAVLIEGMQRMREQGIKSAIVTVNEDDPEAIIFYASTGFKVAFKLGIYDKEV